MTHPVYTREEAQRRETFLAMMWAFSYPGRAQRLPMTEGADVWEGFLLIGDTLLDLETSFFTPEAALTQQLVATGARALPPEGAAYHFYPQMNAAQLRTVAQASVGARLYPDEAATRIIACALGSGLQLRLSGPGVAGQQTLRVGGLAADFWELRARAVRYPLGWDILLVDGGQIVGIPRSAQIEIES